jgi:hypothetical protein
MVKGMTANLEKWMEFIKPEIFIGAARWFNLRRHHRLAVVTAIFEPVVARLRQF